MIPCPIDGSETRVLKNPITGADLHVIASRGLVFSAWRPTAEEQGMLAAGKPVWVVFHGEMIPVFNLTVGDRTTVVPPEVVKRARQVEAKLSSPAAKEYAAKDRRERMVIEVVAWLFAAAILGGAGLVGVLLLRFWYGG